MESGKILTRTEIREEQARLHREEKKLAFTNGCFDILHVGHIQYLEFARDQADALCVGLNADASIKQAKGPLRPIVAENDRAAMLCALRAVDYVVIFDEAEPRDLIAYILPDVLVKGEDWAHYVSGRDIVESNGGQVILAPVVEGHSTTGTIERVLNAYNNKESTE